MSQQITNVPTTPAPASASGVPARTKSHTPLALAIVLSAGILTIGIPLGMAFLMWNRAAIDAPKHLGDAMRGFAADVLQPKVTVNEVVFASIQDMQRQQKLVVLQTTVDADVTREEGSTAWGMYWGTNVARVAVRGAKVQYAIDLSSLGTSDFTYNESAKTLTVTLPPPHLDTTMVSIDPAQIQTLDLRGGWMRWNKQETRENAIAELRPKIITQANSPFMQKEAREAGLDAVTRFLTPLMTNLTRDGVKLNVTYRQ
ncbi:MAG: DUF4230 domain-containing protein [Phycisphaerae bacterium]